MPAPATSDNPDPSAAPDDGSIASCRARGPTGLHRLLLAAVLVVMTLAIYWPTRDAKYAWDDNSHFAANSFMIDLSGLWQIWFNPRNTVNPIAYYPVTLTSFWIEYHTIGPDHPGLLHMIDACLHATNAILVWLLLRRLNVGWAWLAAAIFAVHPVNVESVAWLSEQKNLLSVLFYLLALWAYLSFIDATMQPAAKRWSLYSASLLLFVLAMLSKSVVCTLPVTILLILYWKRKRITLADVLALVPMFVIAAAISVLFAWVNLKLNSSGADLAFSIQDRFLMAGRAVWFYVCDFLWPTPLLVIYPVSIPHQWWGFLLPTGVAAVAVALWLLRGRLTKGPLVAWLFFVLTLSPALGFVSFSFMRYSFVADHFAYLAGIGWIVLIVQALRLASTRAARGVATTLADSKVFQVLLQVVWAMLLVVPLGVLAWGQADLYKSQIALWAYTVEHNPNSWWPHAALANEFLQADDPTAAIEQADAANKIEPNGSSYYAKGSALLRLGRIPEAIAALQTAEKDHDVLDVSAAELGRAYERQHEYARALVEFKLATSMSPLLYQVWNEMAVCYLHMQRWEDARDAAQHALIGHPNYGLAHCNLAVALQQLNDYPGAIEHYRQGLATIPPQFWPMRLQLARVLAATGDLPGAAAEVQRVVDSHPESAEARQLLSLIQAKLGGSATPSTPGP
jgi:protein O-mannosyl-transferase